MKTSKLWIIGFGLMLLTACHATKKDSESQVNGAEATAESATADDNAADGTTGATATDSKTIADFTLRQPNGEPMRAMDIVAKNRITVIDFWASWCGPCRGEMPNMVKLYQQCHQQGVEILGVSLDQDPSAWTQAIGKLNMTWPQVIDADGEVAQRYGIEYIPYTYVVDQQGTVLATNLRGEELLQFVKQQIDQQ